MSVFIIGIGVYGIIQMNTMNQNTRTLYADRVFPMDQLGDVRFYYESILSTAEQVQDHQITFSEASKKIKQSEDSISSNWNAYLLTYLTQEESKLATQAKTLIDQTNITIEKLKLTLDKEDSPAFNKIVNGELYTSFNPVIIKITQLINLQVKVSGEVYQKNNNDYINSSRKFILLIILSLAFAIPFSHFLIKNVKGLIKDLRESNRKTKEAQEKYKAFIKYAGDSIFILDQQLCITDVNDRGCNLLGYSPEELCGTKISGYFSSEDENEFTTKIEIINRQGGSVHERKWRRKNGSEVYTEVNVRVLEGVGYISITRDITDRKKAELDIKKSEEKYRHLFENNPAYIIIWDLENLNVHEVNNSVIEKYGYSKEEWANMSVLQYRSPEDQLKIKEFAKSMLNGNDPVSKMIWKHIKKNGDEMLMEISSHKINYNNRKSILSLGRDITAETSLRISEENFRSLVDHAADAIFMVYDNGIIFDVNQKASELLYYSREELLGMSVVNLHPKEVHKSLPRIWGDLRKNKSLTDQRKLVRKDHSTVEVEISRRMLPDNSGAIAIVRDITERKKIEKSLERSEEKNRALIENISDTIILLNEHAEVVYQSPAFVHTAGFNIEELKGKTIFDFIHPDDRKDSVELIKLAFLNPEVPFQTQYRILHKNGNFIWVEGTIVNLFKNESVNAFVVNYRDITDRKSMEIEREKMMDELLQRNRDLEQFAYIVSHNLRAPVANIIGLSKFLLNPKLKNDDIVEMTNGLSESVNKLDSVIRDLNHILQVKREISEQKELVILSELIRDIKLSIANLIEKENVKFVINFSAIDELFTLKSYLYSILYNLISNSIKYRQPDIAPVIEITSSRDAKNIEITFKDNGIGIDLNKRGEQVFGLYKRFHSHAEGKGMGLFMVKTQVETLGGKISIQSKVNQGTLFILEFENSK